MNKDKDKGWGRPSEDMDKALEGSRCTGMGLGDALRAALEYIYQPKFYTHI